MPNKLALVLTVAFLLGVLVLSGCASSAEPDTVKVQLNGRHHPQFVGFYTAADKGFYSENGIEVTLLPQEEGTSAGTIRDLSEGKTDFAVISADELLLARDRGEPVIAIAAIFQRNPVVYGSLEDSGIKRPQDLSEKTVMATEQGRIQHEALMKKLEMDPALTEILPYEPGVQHLVEGTVDAQMMYRVGTGIELEVAGYAMNYIWLEDYGILSFGDVIVTREELIQEDSSLVARFVEASLGGWRDSIEHQEEAAAIVNRYAPEIEPGLVSRIIEAQIPLIHEGSRPLGYMENGIWAEIVNQLRDAGIVKPPVDVRDAYTNDFVGRL
ncbi:MAG: ABC transporter substrate-binding protein [Dehalococcoidia bacterium]|nr:ABC transporter substrate-binding protein [Dehalococcoidia bacterium]